jgi:cytochrome bd-type quinol oxidase subunit 2
VADLEVRCLEQLHFRGVDEVYEADQQRPQHVSYCDYVHRAYRDGAFLLLPEFLAYVAGLTVVRCPVAARGQELLRSFHSLCLLVSCIGYRTNGATLPTLCNIVAVQRFNLPQR